MMAGMPARVLVGWRRYFEAEPFGGAHEDLRFARVLGLLYDAHRDKEKSPSLPLSHWFGTLKTERESYYDTPEGQHEIGRMWAGVGAAPKKG